MEKRICPHVWVNFGFILWAEGNFGERPVVKSHVFQQVMRYLDIDVRAHLTQGKDGRRANFVTSFIVKVRALQRGMLCRNRPALASADRPVRLKTNSTCH
jgi:hypothetical protein